VIKLPAGEAVPKNITRAFFPHGLGHSLGLQCHDVGCALVKPKPDNPFLRNTSIIAQGQVFTIEPGIYFVDKLLEELRQGEHASAIDWKLVDALSAFGGVRIEDDVVVTGGPAVIRNLTREVLPTGGGSA
jgi:Xaa-Pro dipeptidase